MLILFLEINNKKSSIPKTRFHASTYDVLEFGGMKINKEGTSASLCRMIHKVKKDASVTKRYFLLVNIIIDLV